MIITEYNALMKASEAGSHHMRVLYAALDIASELNADEDVITASAILHECDDEFINSLLTKREWSEELILAVRNCIDAFTGGAPESSEAKSLYDAHLYDSCGAVGEANELLYSGDIDEYLKNDSACIYKGYKTKRGKELASQRRYAGEAFRNSLKIEVNKLNSSGKALLDKVIEEEPIYKRLMLIPADSGFRMEDYFIWCGSVIFAAGEYHMFASRWRKNLKFPSGYMVGSEIVHAVSKKPEGPFEFRDVVIGSRPRGYWDSQMAHNPQIVKAGDTYVLYYLGAGVADYHARRIGYATAKNINGKWTRSNTCIDLGREDCNNPAAYVNKDGSIMLAFRYGNQRIGVAYARRYDSEYKILNEDIMPDVILEDPYLYMHDGKYEMILEDGKGTLTGHERFGAALVSDDGINWTPKKNCLTYDHTLIYNDFSMIEAERRERPQLLLDESGEPTHLYTGVLYNGDTWNVCQPIRKSE